MKYKISLRKRRLAIFLLITFLQSIVLPPVASALTSGPTAPETMSFEPVDATDMVNLMTGDFTYNIPLLEVPGPEGGYPLALSYHAGIKPLEDASWVGLGWSLSPGAINRAVNGYPDDHKDVEREVEDYWEGGSTSTYSVGIGFGIGENAKIGLDISVSNDTYQGFGGSVGLSASLGLGGGFGASAGVSYGTYGFNANAGIGFATQAGINLSARLSSNFKGGTAASFGISHKKSMSSLGISLSSKGVKPSYKLGGISAYQHNNNSGNISTYSVGFSFAFVISLGYRYTRYWMHETDEVRTNGTLHANNSDPGFTVNGTIFNSDVSFDSYSLHQTDINIAENPDPDWVQGGSYPSYDNYSVSGQGIGGNIQPYIFENGSLYRKQVRKIVDDETLLDLSFYHMRNFSKKVNFRFVNDFSNSLQVNTPLLNLGVANPSASPNSYSTLDLAGYNSTDQHLAGSKHIEWYTNQEILNGSAPTLAEYPGLTTAQRTTHSSSNDLLDQMGGVSVTNESGVTYHYALPVYTYGEYNYTGKVDQQGVPSWNKQFNGEPYAYTWLLTAVTGPDYVDKNNNKKVDDDDWGYWVEFEYGEWAKAYGWRTPASGTFKDISEDSETYSRGFKSIYYLDAIKTRSHTALFVKDIRKDGKSVTNTPFGGFLPQQSTVCYEQGSGPNPQPEPVIALTKLPISQMRLDKILLFNNNTLEENNVDLNTIRQHGSQPGDLVTYNVCGTITRSFHYSDNVIDVSDLSQSAISAALGDALKTIELDNDHYDLCPETDNSFEELTNFYNENPVYGNNLGKLTLKSIKYKGLNNSTVMPPLNFEYDYENPGSYTFDVGPSNNSIWVGWGTSDLVGKTVKYTYGGMDYYCLLTESLGSGNFKMVKLGDNMPQVTHNSNAGDRLVKTKNPPFSSTKYDYWGYYKPDFTQSINISPGNVTRIPTTTSVKNTDAWSLRRIETSLGATIGVEYENKKYEENVWQKYDKINYDEAQLNGSQTQVTLSFKEDIDFEDVFAPGDVVKMTGSFFDPAGGDGDFFKIFNNEDVVVIGVSSSSITVENPFLGQQRVVQDIGFLKFMRSGFAYGNGTRAASISVKGDGDTRKTNYNYEGGCISYNPSSLELFLPENLTTQEKEDYEKYFKEDLSFVIALARELPAPAVMYETVSISEENNGVTVPGSKRYTFQVPEQDMIVMNYSSITYASTSSYPDVSELSKRTVTLKDKTTQIGNLLKVEDINAQGIVSNKTTYDYTDDEPDENESDYDQFADQGIVHQAFHELRTKYSGNQDFRYIKGVISKREEFPSILKSTTNTTQGFTTVTKNVAYDFYSGQLTKSETENQKGEFYRSESIPAYKKYADMGLMVNDINKHHMLTQTAYSQNSEIDGWDGNVVGVLSAGATTWNDDWAYRQPYATAYADAPATANKEKVWRKHKQLTWKAGLNPDGSMVSAPSTNGQQINWSTGTPSTPSWETIMTITRYDKYSKPIEEKDLDDNYMALKMGYDDQYILATNGNARYSEFAFSSAEDYDPSTGYFGGEVRKGTGYVNSNPHNQGATHTGERWLSLNNGQEGFLFKTRIGPDVEEFSTRGRRYRASVWWAPNNPGIDLDEGRLFYRIETAGGSVLYSGEEVLTPDYDRKAGNWHQLNLDIEIPSGYNNQFLVVGVKNNNNGAYELYFDDFRFHPIDAPFKAYVYDKLTGELTFILDENNMFTQFEYNDNGQLIKTYVETTENPQGKRLVTESDYHFKRPLD